MLGVRTAYLAALTAWFVLGAVACGGSDGSALMRPVGTPQGGTGGTGDESGGDGTGGGSGGASGVGDTGGTTGGSSSEGGTPGSGGTGGSDTGGAPNGGNAQSGGSDTGGNPSEGGSTSTGGVTDTGGSATGGEATGGMTDTGGSATGGSGAGCSTATFDPCSTIPHFAGTQMVDGNSDDFCGLPHFEFRLADAKLAKNHDTGIPLSGLSALTVRAVVQVAWSAEGMHLYATVYDSAVHGPPQNVGDLWNGDSIELMVSGNQPQSATVQAGGPPDSDGPYQAIFSGAMGADTALASYQSQAFPSSVQYKSFKTSDGYVVEALIPWAASGDVQSGQTMGFNFGINDAETQDNNRDYYGAYAYVCAGTYASCQEPYSNALTWCQPNAE